MNGTESSSAPTSPISNSTNNLVTNETYEHPDTQSFIMADGESYTPLDPKTKASDSDQGMPDSTAKDDSCRSSIKPNDTRNPSHGFLQPHAVEQHNPYLTLVGDKEFLNRHPSAITDTYLEVPISESENLSESGQPEDRGVSCHLYAEIDKPCLVACPMPPKTPI